MTEIDRLRAIEASSYRSLIDADHRHIDELQRLHVVNLELRNEVERLRAELARAQQESPSDDSPGPVQGVGAE